MRGTVIDELIALLGYDIQGEEELKRFNKSLDDLGTRAFEIGQKLGRFAAYSGAAFTAAFATLGGTVLSTAGKFESYLATLETIEGSSEKAQAAMSWIKDFAKTTPYEVDELTAAFVKLRSYGLDPTDGTMTVLGDTASGMGKSIDQVVEALADATTFQFERLRELGIVASQSGDQVSFAWTENGKAMSRTISKTSTEVTKFLNDVWGRKFNGAMIRQSKTWSGMWSNIGDTWTDFQLRIANGGFFDTAKNKLADFMDALARWDASGALDRFAESLSSGFSFVADVVGVVIDRIARHVLYINENFEKIRPWFRIFAILFGVLVAAAFPLTTILAILALVFDDLLTYMQGGESVIGNFIQWLRDIIPGAGAAEEAILKLAGVIGGALFAAMLLAPRAVIGGLGRLALAAVSALAGFLWTGIVALAPRIGLAIATMLGLASNPVGWAISIGLLALAIINLFDDSIREAVSTLDFSAIASSAWDSIVAAFSSLDWLSLAAVIGTGLAVAFNLAPALITSATAWVTALIVPIGAALYAGLAGLAVKVAAGLGTAFIGLSNPVGWAVILAGVAAALVTYFWDDLIALWNALDFASLGAAIGQGILNGLASMAGAIRSFIAGLIPSWATSWMSGDGASAAAQIGAMGAANAAKVNNSSTGAAVAQDNSTRTQNVNVEAPVNVNVQQSTQAPAAVGAAIGAAVNRGAQPSRSQGGSAF